MSDDNDVLGIGMLMDDQRLRIQLYEDIISDIRKVLGDDGLHAQLHELAGVIGRRCAIVAEPRDEARKDEIAKRAAHDIYDIIARDDFNPDHAIDIRRCVEQALTSYEEERTPQSAELLERVEWLETQLGLVYDHVTNGLLSKPYAFNNVKSTIDDCVTEQVNEAVKEELEARTPSGEGWQQRIAAMWPWHDVGLYDVEERCFFCEASRTSTHEDHAETCLWQNAKVAICAHDWMWMPQTETLQCRTCSAEALNEPQRQNAKDATPPASSGEGK